VVNPKPYQGKLSTNNGLNFHEAMDVTNVLELLHQLSKISGLRVARKHSIVHHAQRGTAEINKSSSLGSAILELDNTVTTCFVRPKINIGFGGKSQ
jgi:hypothetical protein